MKARAGNLGNQPVAWRTRNGRLMFSSMKGVVVVEPDRLKPNTLIPPVYIEKVILNRKEQPVNRYSQLPLGAGELEIHYSALSYSAPDKLRFKYMLEGFDTGWIDAGGRRLTHYANLPPGNYQFHVTAGNADGSWNQAGAIFAFYLRPPFYRTWWFLAALAAFAIGLTWLMYRLRLRGLQARYRAVLAERNNISREIHDTLAQNLAGIALQLDALHMQLPEVSKGLRQTLDEACNLTRYSLAEARRAIGDLRSDELESRELGDALPEIAQRACGSLEANVQVIGSPRKLDPVTEKHILRIFQEALTNVLRHAHARKLDVELRYAPRSLRLRVFDDGDGFDPQHIIPALSGHYGLIGMRERAARIGGCLTLNSRPGEGTELLVEVPF
jgi:signal transduction histidine kinase